MNKEHYPDPTADSAAGNTSVSFKIPIRFPGLNEYSDAERANRQGGASMKKQWSRTAALYFRGKNPIDRPVHIAFTWYEQEMRRDKDNVAFAKKFILDGMQLSGYLPNDNNKYVLGFSDAFVYRRGNGVIVTVTCGRPEK
jgi:hypothetical protein